MKAIMNANSFRGLTKHEGAISPPLHRVPMWIPCVLPRPGWHSWQKPSWLTHYEPQWEERAGQQGQQIGGGSSGQVSNDDEGWVNEMLICLIKIFPTTCFPIEITTTVVQRQFLFFLGPLFQWWSLNIRFYLNLCHKSRSTFTHLHRGMSTFINND